MISVLQCYDFSDKQRFSSQLLSNSRCMTRFYSLYGLGGRFLKIRKRQQCAPAFLWILNSISRSITCSLLSLKGSYLVKWPISTWSFMWWCQFIWISPQFLDEFRNGQLWPSQGAALGPALAYRLARDRTRSQSPPGQRWHPNNQHGGRFIFCVTFRIVLCPFIHLPVY